MTDKYVNKAYGEVTESAAGTLSFGEIQTGMAMFEKVAWIIHRIHWFPSAASLLQLTAVSDYLTMALVGSDKMSSLSLRDQAVYDIFVIRPLVYGTAASAEQMVIPVIRDMSNLPGQGLIVPPRPLYIACISGGFANPAIVSARIEFTYKELKADEYWELVEATRIIE